MPELIDKLAKVFPFVRRNYIAIICLIAGVFIGILGMLIFNDQEFAIGRLPVEIGGCARAKDELDYVTRLYLKEKLRPINEDFRVLKDFQAHAEKYDELARLYTEVNDIVPSFHLNQVLLDSARVSLNKGNWQQACIDFQSFFSRL